MRTAAAFLAAAGLLIIPQSASAAETGEVSYDVAIRCAAVDTLISSVLGGKEADEANQGVSEYFDSMTQHWIVHASGLKGQEKALADYVEVTKGLAARAVKAEGEAEMQALVGEDMATCSQLEESVVMSENAEGE